MRTSHEMQNEKHLLRNAAPKFDCARTPYFFGTLNIYARWRPLKQVSIFTTARRENKKVPAYVKTSCNRYSLVAPPRRDLELFLTALFRNCVVV